MTKEIEISGNSWQKQTVLLRSPFTDAHSRLRVVLLTEGTVDMDHISLFPVKTWKNRENGLRADLAQALYDLNPGVFRFPGGCIIEGNTLATRYQWKNSVGPVENRPLNENRWNYTFKHKAFPDYFQSLGLGYYEYFLLSEDLGAEPLPVLSCGLSCQYESNEVVPLDELDLYVQDALDLIEFANGPATSTWGKLRAEMGHPEPFHLKMIGIGNEQWDKVYTERLEVFTKAIRAHYPDIKIVGSSGPNADGDKFDYLWPEMKRIGVDLVDEHYYMAPDWFFANAARYDSYDRRGPKVFAGEYASHDHPTGKTNNFLAALSEAAFMTGLERNADVVHLATYAALCPCGCLAVESGPYLVRQPPHDAHPELLRPADVWNECRYRRSPSADGRQAGGWARQPLCYGLLDAPTGEIILKLVNAGSTPAQVQVNFNGLRKRQLIGGSCTYLQNCDWRTVNTLEQEALVPRIRPVQVGAQSLDLELQPRSFSVYRLH